MIRFGTEGTGSSAIRCSRCGETLRTWLIWSGFKTDKNIDMVCCLADL